MTAEIGGVTASPEDISDAIAILASRQHSTAVKQPLKAQGNVLAECDYHLVAETYLERHPDRVTLAGNKEKHAARVKNAFVAFLTEQLAVVGSDPTEVPAANVMENQSERGWNRADGTEIVNAANDVTRGRREHLFRGRRITVRDLVDAGLLRPGMTLVFDRPQTGETLGVTVTRTGRLMLPDGRETRSPSGAIRELSGKNVDGWYAWRTQDGSVLHGLRQRLLADASLERGGDEIPAAEARQDDFLASAKQAAESGSPRQLAVGDLVGIWGARARDYGVNERIAADLNNNGMTTIPDFRAVTLEDTVAVVLTALDITPALSSAQPSMEAATLDLATLAIGQEEEAWDHGLTIGNLRSASKNVCSIAPDATFDEAITLMLTNDYSQLAVIIGSRNLKGAVTWKSIAKARNADPAAKLSAAIIKAEAVPYTADLIETLPVIQRHEFVFVRGPDNTVTGIVTLADVVDAYGQMATPFFIIGRIDQSLRRVIEATFPMNDITQLCDPGGQRGMTSCDQLTLGDYRRILENPDAWDKLGWALHRRTFCARLGDIADVRNNLMHFNNDPLPEDVVSMLQNFNNLLLEYGT